SYFLRPAFLVPLPLTFPLVLGAFFAVPPLLGFALTAGGASRSGRLNAASIGTTRSTVSPPLSLTIVEPRAARPRRPAASNLTILPPPLLVITVKRSSGPATSIPVNFCLPARLP